jgi:copper chaperone
MSTFNVPDMTCGHCVKSITSAIKEAVPAAEVSCDLNTKVVTVTGPHDTAQIKDIIQEAGYSPELT